MSGAVGTLSDVPGRAANLGPPPTGRLAIHVAAGRYRWLLEDPFGQVLAESGDSYASRTGARSAATNFSAKAEGYTYEVYPAGPAGCRWRVKPTNGCVVARSSGVFPDRPSAVRAADRARVCAAVATGP